MYRGSAAPSNSCEAGAVAAMGGAAVFTGLALAASKARASSSFGEGGVAGLDDVVEEPVAE